MRIERDSGPAGGGPAIRGFAAGGFRVDDTVHAAVLLTPERAVAWTPPPLATLDLAALDAVLVPGLEFLLLGTGPVLVQPPRALVAALDARDIGIEAMDSRAAARAWGVLRGEGRTIAAALYPL